MFSHGNIYILHVPFGPGHREQQYDRRVIVRLQDGADHALIGPSLRGFLIVVDGKLQKHDIRLSSGRLHHIPLIAHHSQRRARSAQSCVYVGQLCIRICLPQPCGKTVGIGLLISVGKGALRHRPADKGNRHLLAVSHPLQHFFQPAVRAGGENRGLQHLLIPVLFLRLACLLAALLRFIRL